MAFGIVVDGLPRYELLCFPQKVDRNQLLVAELGTVIIAQALFSFCLIRPRFMSAISSWNLGRSVFLPE